MINSLQGIPPFSRMNTLHQGDSLYKWHNSISLPVCVCVMRVRVNTVMAINLNAFYCGAIILFFGIVFWCTRALRFRVGSKCLTCRVFTVACWKISRETRQIWSDRQHCASVEIFRKSFRRLFVKFYIMLLLKMWK